MIGLPNTRSRRPSGLAYFVILGPLLASCATEEPTGFPDVSPNLTVVSGDGQVGEEFQELPSPLVVRVENARQRPVAGQLVNFVVTEGGGSVFAGSALTGRDGLAYDWWTLGGAGPQAVEVRATDPSDGSKVLYGTFLATATLPGPDPSPESCDQALVLASGDPLDAARAIGMCKIAQDANDWGLVSAAWTMPDGSPPPTDPTLAANFHLGHGILADFGVIVPEEGNRLLALSTGVARSPSDPGYQAPSDKSDGDFLKPYGGGFSKGFSGSLPETFPQALPACPPIAGAANDPAGLSVTLRVPQDADGFSLRFKYYTADYPYWVCTPYVDQFAAMLGPPGSGVNVAFDATGGPVTASSPQTILVCAPGPNPQGVNYTCPEGTQDLQGTGFQWHGASPWLTATAPATPGSEITLRLVIYDSADGTVDSTVLIDDFRWTMP